MGMCAEWCGAGILTFAFCPQPLSRTWHEEDAELGSIILMYFSVCLEVFWKLCEVQVNTFILKLWLVV